MNEPRNPLRGEDAPYDAFAKVLQQQEFSAKRPSRLESQQSSTLVSTIPQQRMRLRAHGNSTPQSIPDGSTQNTIIVIDTVTTTFPTPNEFDTTDGRNTAGLLNSNGLLIPSTGMITGTWLIYGQVVWAGNGTGLRELDIIVNGTAGNLLAQARHQGHNALQVQQVFTLVNDPPAGTTYKLMVNQTSGAALDIHKEAYRTFIAAVHLW